MAAGRFAPGHLGELTRIVPFEMVDAAITATCLGQQRVRALPARVVVYLLLAAALLADCSYSQVFAHLCAGPGLSQRRGTRRPPTASAMGQARARLGPAPLKVLFELLTGAAATALSGAGADSVRFHGLLVTALDGTTVPVPDEAANAAVYTHHGHGAHTTPSPCWRGS